MFVELKWIRRIQEYVKITKCNFSIIKFKTNNWEILPDTFFLPDTWYHIQGDVNDSALQKVKIIKY